jgi:hypothetical protein
MSQRRIFLIAVALGFVGGFSFVAVANGSAETPRPAYSAAG